MALTDNLISYWKLDEASGNALDAHGSNDLTDTNTVGAGTGKVNGARDFESTNSEYFTHADNADLSTGDIDFTLAAWVQIETKALMAIFNKWLTNGNLEFEVGYYNSDDRFGFAVSSNGSTTSYTLLKADNLGGPSTGTWYFVVAWHDSVNNTINIQVNNGTVNSAFWSAGVFNSTETFTLGGGNSGIAWDGLIDEAGFWKRVLTSQERTDLYNSGNGLSYDDFGGGGGRTTRNTRAWPLGMEIGMSWVMPSQV